MTLPAPDKNPFAEKTPVQVQQRAPTLIAIFLILLIMPLIIQIGSLRLSPYRLLLLFAVVPLFLTWLSSAHIRKRPCDWLILFYVLWSGIAMSVTMGVVAAIEPFGMQVIETCGAYFLARCLIRDADSYEFMVRWFFRIMLVLLPFALLETFTARNVLLDVFRAIGPAFPDTYKEPRWGLDRVQSIFEHPILYGVFCGSAIGMVAYLNSEIRMRAWRMMLVVLNAALSLSSGPLSGIVMQIMIVTYEKVTRGIAGRWRILGGFTALIYVVVDVLSNRAPVEVFISYVAFSAHTAYNRLRIWDLGSAWVLKHPFFGDTIAPDFARPYWMSSSTDMFWLLKSMQFGLPSGLALVAAFLYIVVKVCRANIADMRINACRSGILISLFGVFIVGWTVHFWNATYVLVCFLFGAAAWIMDAVPIKKDPGTPPIQPSDVLIDANNAPPPRTIL